MDELSVGAGCAYNFDYVTCCGREVVDYSKFREYETERPPPDIMNVPSSAKHCKSLVAGAFEVLFIEMYLAAVILPLRSSVPASIIF